MRNKGKGLTLNHASIAENHCPTPADGSRTLLPDGGGFKLRCMNKVKLTLFFIVSDIFTEISIINLGVNY